MRLLQRDGSLSARELGDQVGLTPAPCWRRVRALEDGGVIAGRVALVDPSSINLDVAALVNIRTNDHSSAWIESFRAAVARFPEIVETYRTSGDIDYTLKVMVPSIAAYDAFYKRLIDAVELYDVRTIFVMEEIKHTTALPPRLRNGLRCNGLTDIGYPCRRTQRRRFFLSCYRADDHETLGAVDRSTNWRNVPLDAYPQQQPFKVDAVFA